MLTTLAVITATVTGVMVGVEFAVAVFVNPILLRQPAGPALEARAGGARVLGRVMPLHDHRGVPGHPRRTSRRFLASGRAAADQPDGRGDEQC